MLTHPTVDKLHPLRCAGMAKALAEQFASHEVRNLTFEERLGLLVDRELTERHSRQLTNRLRRAKLRHVACIVEPVAEPLVATKPRSHGAESGFRPTPGRSPDRSATAPSAPGSWRRNARTTSGSFPPGPEDPPR